jgi:imidazole glycerol-phosphate synthase subunit HisF
MPVLLLKDGDLVKTRKFREPSYVGDPINAVRIFNDKKVDELILLDISEGRPSASTETLLAEIASEAFMPIAFGGGVVDVQQAERLFRCGVEKVVVNTATVSRPTLVKEIAKQFGRQSVVVSIDVRRVFGRGRRVITRGGRTITKLEPSEHARQMEDTGAGEILVTSIEHEGMLKGYDVDLVASVSAAVRIPVIANGGARNVADFVCAVNTGHASAVAASSMFIYQGKHRAVLINFPDETTLRKELYGIAS